MLRSLIVALALALGACAGNFPPIQPPGSNPPPSPTPSPLPEQECMAGVPWCSEVSQQCSSTLSPCKHNPTQDPKHCELAPACSETPTEPPVTPPPSTDCSPVLDPGLSAPIAPDASWPYAVDKSTPTSWRQSIWTAVQNAKLACPAAWVGECMANGSAGIDHGYLLISKQLQLKGMAASQGRTPEGEVKDHLWIQRSSGSKDWNATKLFYYGNGCLITGDGAFTAHGWYTYAGGGAQPPTPPVNPTPPSGCTDPLPSIYWAEATLPRGFDSALVNHTRYVMVCKEHGRDIDCAVTNARACDYCGAIGMGEAGGQIRCGCPVRNECKPAGDEPQNFKCEERGACEQYLTGGTVLESRNGATCEFAHDNPFMFKPSGGNCRLCGANGTIYNGERQGCGGWF